MCKLTCFKSYDIRGKLEVELNEDIAYRIGFAFAQYLLAQNIAVGIDTRLSSRALQLAVMRGITDYGANAVDLGLTGTEEVYFAAQHLDIDGGIEITASHNPIDYNGMKFIGKNALPLDANIDLPQIEKLVRTNNFTVSKYKGKITQKSILTSYIEHLCSYVNLYCIKPLAIVTNVGNGAAGHVIDALEEKFIQLNIPITLHKIHHEADGNFPHGIPNPLLVENRQITSNAVLQYKADIGIAWDGDFDRCFFFDEQGRFIEGYYIVGLLSAAFLSKNPGEKIIHDPRLIWNTIDIINHHKGIAIQSKTGHAFMKTTMRKENAIYGGEMSSHHYFRNFAYCDSGMIPWLLIIELLSKHQTSLSNLINMRINKYNCSGEINYSVEDSNKIIQKIKKYYQPQSIYIDQMDGLSLSFFGWRFNLRASNTEPLLRLNIEVNGKDNISIQQRIKELDTLIIAM